HEFGKHGIKVPGLEVDLAAMQKRKQGIVRQLTGGIAGLFKANKVEGLVGHGKLLADRKVELTPKSGEPEVLEARYVILATGSAPVELKVAPFAGDRIGDSWGALEFEQVPQTLGVVGAGVIGLELGSGWSRLGSEVVVLEAMDQFLAAVDRDIASEAAKQFKRQGLEIHLGAKVTAAEASDKGVKVDYEDSSGKQSIEVEKLVVAVGRKPYTDGLL